jgi:hypothetical protein
MNVLVVASEAISASQLRAALGEEIDADRTQVMVVVPALTDSPLKFWFSDADGAIARAEEVRRRSVQQLGSAGVSATADTGESDPLLAIEDALSTFDADRILLFTHGPSERRYREDVDLEEIRERFGVPVEEAPVS